MQEILNVENILLEYEVYSRTAKCEQKGLNINDMFHVHKHFEWQNITSYINRIQMTQRHVHESSRRRLISWMTPPTEAAITMSTPKRKFYINKDYNRGGQKESTLPQSAKGKHDNVPQERQME